MNPVVLNYIILMLRNLRRNPGRTILTMLSTTLSLFVFTALMSLAQQADGLVSQSASSLRKRLVKSDGTDGAAAGWIK